MRYIISILLAIITVTAPAKDLTEETFWKVPGVKISPNELLVGPFIIRTSTLAYAVWNPWKSNIFIFELTDSDIVNILNNKAELTKDLQVQYMCPFAPTEEGVDVCLLQGKETLASATKGMSSLLQSNTSRPKDTVCQYPLDMGIVVSMCSSYKKFKEWAKTAKETSNLDPFQKLIDDRNLFVWGKGAAFMAVSNIPWDRQAARAIPMSEAYWDNIAYYATNLQKFMMMTKPSLLAIKQAVSKQESLQNKFR